MLGLAWRVTEHLDPNVNLRSGDSLCGARETASSSKDQGRRKHMDEVKHSHAPTTTPKHGVTGGTRPAGTMPLVQKQGVVFCSCFARWKRCWDLRTLSWRMELISGQDRIWWNKWSRTTPHVTQMSSSSTWGKPRYASLRPASARSCRQQPTIHGVVLTMLQKTQMLLDD